MHMDDVKRTMAQAGALAERLSRTSEALTQSNLQATASLTAATQAMPEVMHRAANQALANLTNDAARAVRDGLHQPVQAFGNELAGSTHGIRDAVAAMTQAQQRIGALTNKLTLLTAAVLLVLTVTAVAAAGLVWHYKDVVAQNQLEAKLLRAYNHADVNFCGDQLCARVDRSDKRYGEYVPVKPR